MKQDVHSTVQLLQEKFRSIEGVKCTVGQITMEKVQQTLDNVLAKLEKIDSIEEKIVGISSQITGFDTRLTTLEGRTSSLEKQYAELNPKVEKVGELEKSVQFLSAKYEEMKKSHDATTKNYTDLQRNVNMATAESLMLKGMVEDLKNNLEQEKRGRNNVEQYWRTCLNLKLCNVPIQPGEEVKTPTPTNPVTRAVIDRVCAAAQINLPPGAIDVCHRLGDDTVSPIIIRFTGKGARYHFHNQRKKLKNISSLDVNFEGLPQIQQKPDRNGRTRRGGRGQQQRKPTVIPAEGVQMYTQDHLTKYSKSLLKATKTALEGKFQFPAYVMDGEVRCKIKEDNDYDVIGCGSDLRRVMEKHNINIDLSLFEHL